MRSILKLALLAMAGIALIRAARRPGATPDYPYIRPAGRREMRNPPKNWDIVDEAGDQSFPASDPPGTY